MQSWQHDCSCINYLNSDWNECYHCKCNILKNMNIFEHASRLSIIGWSTVQRVHALRRHRGSLILPTTHHSGN
jgi:hypothetical protein